jgi:hypothetical protein
MKLQQAKNNEDNMSEIYIKDFLAATRCYLLSLGQTAEANLAVVPVRHQK